MEAQQPSPNSTWESRRVRREAADLDALMPCFRRSDCLRVQLNDALWMFTDSLPKARPAERCSCTALHARFLPCFVTCANASNESPMFRAPKSHQNTVPATTKTSSCVPSGSCLMIPCEHGSAPKPKIMRHAELHLAYHFVDEPCDGGSNEWPRIHLSTHCDADR